jgi:hypothetical protein
MTVRNCLTVAADWSRLSIPTTISISRDRSLCASKPVTLAISTCFYLLSITASMDPLQEILHDDGGLIQNSAGLMSDLSKPTGVNENEISPYKGLNETSGMPHRVLNANRALDPIERLPPELSTLFIRNALQSHDHSSRLMELTTISKLWQSFLFSTPVLWSELVIDERQEDLLVILSVFVVLSGTAELKVTFPRKPIDWAGLASVLSPATQRITSLSFEGYDDASIRWVPSVIPTIFRRLGDLPHLKEVDFDRLLWGGDSLLQTMSLLLPSTVKFRGSFEIEMPESYGNSQTPGRVFDTIKYNAFGTLEPITPSSNSFNLRYSAKKITIHSNDATPAQLQRLAGRLVECNCIEQVMYRTTHNLHILRIDIPLSHVKDVIDCLRLLMRLQTLQLSIQIEDCATTLDWPPNNTGCRNLKEFSVFFYGDEVPGVVLSAQRTIRNLFSAFQALYPSVVNLCLRGHTWPFFASSYLQSLRALKTLTLELEDSEYNPPEMSINLQSLQYLEIYGPAYFDSLHVPNLLKLMLESPDLDMWPTLLSHPRIRSLTLAITSYLRTQAFSLDCTELRDLSLYNIPPRATWGLLSLSNVVSITLTSGVGGVNPSNNQLCLALLCNPERLPSLQQLDFSRCVDWDVLFLMLQRRNIGKYEVQRIDTVTLPFIPFALQQPLARILAAESVELPPLVSLSLEATREVMFDSTVYVYI